MAELPPTKRADAELTTLLMAHRDPLLSYMLRMGIPRQDVDDLLQDVLEVAYRAYNRFDPARGTPRVWLLGIATRLILSYRRRLRRRHEDLVAEVSVEPADEAPSSEVRLISIDRQEILDELLAEIPEERRSIFILHEIHEHDMSEIANALSLNLSTAWSRHRAAWRDLEAAVRRWQARQRRKGHDDVPAILIPLLEQARAKDALPGPGLRLLHPERSPSQSTLVGTPRSRVPQLRGSPERRASITRRTPRSIGLALGAAAALFGPMDIASDHRAPREAIHALAAPVALSLLASTPVRPAERAPERSPSAQEASTRPSAVPVGARAMPRPAATTRGGQLRAELELIERALGAIRLEQAQHARQLLEQHARQFPDGLLAPTRKTLLRQLSPVEGD